MKKYLLSIFLFMFGFQTFAQKVPIHFGKPSMDDLKKSVYKIDTTAAAIILCNYGTFDPDKLSFDHIIRVKILKKEGLDWGNWTFKSLTRADIRGKTYNLVNGKMEVDKLASKSIFHEDIANGYYVTKVTMPNVKVGSIIDIEVSYIGIPSSWYFQEKIPMLYSELDMEPSTNITFNKNYFGYVGFNKASGGKWITQNVPAFQSEPYMAPANNYMAHFEFDLKSIYIPGEPLHEYASSWQEIADRLNKDGQFGDALKSSPHFFKEMGDSIAQVAKSDIEKVNDALAIVHRIKWNGKNRLFSSSVSGLKYIFTKGEGNSSDINLSLISLLRHAGIEAYPVIMRTRSEGQLSMFNPTLFNLNYVMAYAKVDSTFYLIDGTEKNLPFPYLPERCRNGKGRVMLKDKTEWVDLTNHVQSTSTSFYNLTLNNDQDLSGTANYSYSGHPAYAFRQNYKNLGSHEKYMNEQMQEDNNLTLTKDTLMNLNDPDKPMVEKATVSFSNQIIQVDSLSYLYLIPERVTENPFKQEKRTYPVDFDYPFVKSGIVVIKLPADYKVVKLPESIRYDMPDKSGSFLFQTGVNGNSITAIYRFTINRPLFLVSEYLMLKGLYMEMITKEAEPVVLKKM